MDLRTLFADGLWYTWARPASAAAGVAGADAAERARTEFLARVSHELRTPLTAVLGYTELALARCPDAPGDDPVGFNDLLGSIRRNGEALLALISDVLEASRSASAPAHPAGQQAERGPALGGCDRGALAREASDAGRPAAEARGLAGVRILVAEDNRDSQRVLAIRLGMTGAEPVVAPHGRAAVDLAVAARDEGRPFDLVLMDMQMPVLDGYEATRLLRSLGFTTPVVALTAHALPEDRLECLRFGCDEYAVKPVNWPALLELISRLLARSGSGAATGERG
jgi:CheY-like chemotaxis protein